MKSSIVDLVNIRTPSWLSLERSMMKSSTLFEHGPLPPYVHLASTRRHSRDRFSQAFPVFRALPLPCIILNENRRTKNGGRPGNEATSFLHTSISICLSVQERDLYHDDKLPSKVWHVIMK